MSKLGNIAVATKMFLNLFGNIFASWEACFRYNTGFQYCIVPVAMSHKPLSILVLKSELQPNSSGVLL